MRFHWHQQQEHGIFRGAELPRLMTAIVMLAVLYMLIVRAGDARMWRWLVGNGKNGPIAAHSEAPRPPKALTPANGPTDKDADQQAAAREEFQAITDGTLTIQPEEMEPYKRLLAWVRNQSFEQLDQRARSDLLFTQFHDQPDKYRGQLVALDLNVRRVLDAETKPQGVALYEVWGFTAESGDRLYVAMVVDLPPGMPIGPFVNEKARFAGYFLKLQGYLPPGAKPGQAPEKAPLLIGRLQWKPPTPTENDNATEWIWGLGANHNRIGFGRSHDLL